MPVLETVPPVQRTLIDVVSPGGVTSTAAGVTVVTPVSAGLVKASADHALASGASVTIRSSCPVVRSGSGVTASPVLFTNATPGKPYTVQVRWEPLVKMTAKFSCPAPGWSGPMDARSSELWHRLVAGTGVADGLADPAPADGGAVGLPDDLAGAPPGSPVRVADDGFPELFGARLLPVSVLVQPVSAVANAVQQASAAGTALRRVMFHLSWCAEGPSWAPPVTDRMAVTGGEGGVSGHRRHLAMRAVSKLGSASVK